MCHYHIYASQSSEMQSPRCTLPLLWSHLLPCLPWPDVLIILHQNTNQNKPVFPEDTSHICFRSNVKCNQTNLEAELHSVKWPWKSWSEICQPQMAGKRNCQGAGGGDREEAGVNTSPHTHALESPQILLQIGLVLNPWGTNLMKSHHRCQVQ